MVINAAYLSLSLRVHNEFKIHHVHFPKFVSMVQNSYVLSMILNVAKF